MNIRDWLYDARKRHSPIPSNNWQKEYHRLYRDFRQALHIIDESLVLEDYLRVAPSANDKVIVKDFERNCKEFMYE